MKSARATVGFRVKSGWAAAVLLAGTVGSPHVVDSRAVTLSDPDAPESKQPYHARMGTLEKDHTKIRRRTRLVERVTSKSVAGLLKSYRSSGYKTMRAVLVVGSDIDPASIGNEHIRAHALEGRLFRIVLEKALRSHRLPVRIIIERELYSRAGRAFHRSEGNLKRTLTVLGQPVRSEWRSEEKNAALAAWMHLRAKS